MEMKPTHFSNLERKGKYIVKTQNGIYKGIYLTQPLYFFPYIVLSFVTKNENGKKYKFHEALFEENDIFYDAEEYINEIKERAKKARQQMETRALEKILKCVVNEMFQWS
jgi:hypothetical protein